MSSDFSHAAADFFGPKTLTSTRLTDICAEMGLAWCPDSHWVMGRWRRWDQAGNPPWEGVKALFSAFAGTLRHKSRI